LIRVRRALWTDTLNIVRACGARNRRECVVFWLAPISDPGKVIAAVHPLHSATAGHYDVDQEWLHECWVDMRQKRRTIVAQVHIHGGRAFHSLSDDEGPVVHVPGFLSLVLPSFGVPDDCLEEAYLARIDSAGSFRQVSVREELLVTR